MATLLTCQAITKGFHAKPLFEDLSLGLVDGEHIGLIGPNGAGKSTLLRIVAGLEPIDGGEMNVRRSARVGYLAQEDRFPNDATVATVLGDAIAADCPEPHERDAQVAIMLSKLGFPSPDDKVEALSGGWRKRLALARELIRQPDLLLLDEPTNHLDLDGILWLEELLRGATFAFVTVSHDRRLLDRVTTRMVELSAAYPGGTFSVEGSYSRFLTKRAEFLEGQQAQQKSLAGRVRREIEWLKAGAKARTTKAKYRVQAAGRMQSELADLRTRNRQLGGAEIEFDSTGRKTKKLLVAEGLAKGLGGRKLFEDVAVWLSPGSRLGLLGGNGSGKSTLIRVLSGALPPDAGTIKRADDLRVVVFDQQRDALPKDITLSQALCGESDTVIFRGRPIHVAGWAQRFMFRAAQLKMKVGDLSGGEQARILIARLMVQPADVLMLDEPTNDLDIDSLDVLEESLEQFPGAIVLVTHDRFMLDRICDQILALDGRGRVDVYADVAQWQAAQARPAESPAAPKPRRKVTNKPTPERGQRLTFKEKQELEQMEAAILAAEAQQDACRKAVEDPRIAADHVELQKACEVLHAAVQRVAALYARWEELEAKRD